MSTPVVSGLSAQYVRPWSDEMVEPLAEDIALFALSQRPVRVHVSFYLADEAGKYAPVLSEEGVLEVSSAGAQYVSAGGGHRVSVRFEGGVSDVVVTGFARDVLMV